jgi:hypothetical protein
MMILLRVMRTDGRRSSWLDIEELFVCMVLIMFACSQTAKLSISPLMRCGLIRTTELG